MKRLYSLIFSTFFIFGFGNAQYVKLEPGGVGPEDAATLIFDATQGNKELVGASSVYIHHGVITASPSGTEWKYVKGNWGNDDGIGKMTKVSGEENKWQISFTPSIRSYFGVPSQENIFRISCVFRNADGSKKGTISPGNYGWGFVASNQDVYVDLNLDNFVTINNPSTNEGFISQGESLFISATASSNVSSMKVLLDDGNGFTEVASVSSGKNISYEYFPSKSVILGIKVTAVVNGESVEEVRDYNLILKADPNIADVPPGLKKGVNYYNADLTKISLVLQAPGKEFVYAVGDFSDWKINEAYLMNKSTDGEMFWIDIDGLTPQQSYVYQYWVDGTVKVGDSYADQVADPWNDQHIPVEKFSGIPSYDKQEFGTATVFKTGQSSYEWAAAEESWQRPDVNHLMIYELLIRDFLASSSYDDLIDTLNYIKRLGVNAIELMPVSEFEGNDSWGYNPSFYFAPDKYYGAKADLKRFIETAHSMGLAVIMDIVLNHAYGQNPMLQMYFDKANNRPANDNPWFNVNYVGPFEWGYDFNHESGYTKEFIDEVNRYWIEEYHFDGFRFDFTKGFTNYAPNDNLDGFDQSRIDILKRMADKIWEADNEAYIILEHWASPSEENILADHGMKMWRNKSYDFVPVTIGNISGNFQGTDALSHVSLFNSHDERRIAEHALTEGRSNGSYNIKDPVIMYERVKLAAAFAYLMPGPKMMWQFDELGYDIDIDFNGRVGRKPLPWGSGSLDYYEDPLRQHIYKTYQGILNVRNTIDPANLAKAQTSHKLDGTVRRLVYDMDDIDLVVVGNFGLNNSTINPNFTETGIWYDYFSGEEMNVDNVNSSLSLAPGEWHIYTTMRLSDGIADAVAIFQDPVTITPFPFTMNDEITITFDAGLASPDGTEGLVGADKVYFHSGLVEGSPDNRDLTFIVGTLNDDGIGEMTKLSGDNDKWEIKLVPSNYYDATGGVEVFKVGMYFRDGDNINRGLGFRNSIIFYDVSNEDLFVWTTPDHYDANTEITIHFNANKGNRELVGASKVYMHSGMSIIDSDDPLSNAWDNTVGNWGQDDGVGQMQKTTGKENFWEIILTPRNYYGLASNDEPTWLAAVFRNADGSKKGTGNPGDLENGFIASNLDFFIKNEATTANEEPHILPYEIFPNPTSGIIGLSLFTEDLDFVLYDARGKILLKSNLSESKNIDLSNLPSGIYIYNITGKLGRKVGKLIKR